MTTDAIILFFILAFLAEILGTISGFGSSVFFVPIAAYFFDFHSVLGITAVFHIFSNLSKIYLFRKGVDWKLILYLGIPAVVFVSLGAFLSKFIESSLLETLLAIFLIAFSLLFLIFHNLKLRQTKFNTLLSGSFSGFIAGLIGTGGAIRGMTLSAFKLNKEIFIVTSAFIDFGVDLSRGVVYYFNGFIHMHDMKFILILVGISFIGTYLGKRILNYISEEIFKKIVLGLILLIGLAHLFNEIYTWCN